MEVLCHLSVGPDPGFLRPGLHVADMLAAHGRLHVLGIVALVRWHEVVVERDCILNELDDSGVRRQWEHLVSPDVEVPSSRRPVILEDAADLFKYLLHDRVLPEVIVAAFELQT